MTQHPPTDNGATMLSNDSNDSSINDLDVVELTNWFANQALSLTLPEAQGMYCGLRCAGITHAAHRWLVELMPTSPHDQALSPHIVAKLQQLTAYTDQQLADAACRFDLLLAPPSATLIEQATALVDWVRGFLYGSGIAGRQLNQLSAAAQEIYTDLITVTQLDLSALVEDSDETEANEAALFYVIEHVRMGVMLLDAGESDQ